MAGCSSGHAAPPLPVQGQLEAPEYVGRNCVTTIRPDGTPDYSNGCTGADQLRFEQRYEK